MSPPAVLSLYYWMVHHTHLFLWYFVWKKTTVMSIHVRIHLDQAEGVPAGWRYCQISSESERHTGRLGRESVCLSTGVKASPCVCVPVCCKSIFWNATELFSLWLLLSCKKTKTLYVSNCSQKAEWPLYASSPHRHFSDNTCTLTCFVFFSFFRELCT